MAGDPHPVFQDGVAPEKANARAFLAIRLGSADDLRALDLSTSWLVWVGSTLYARDASDTTSEDDGSTVIRDGNSNVWKRIDSSGLNVNAAGPVSEKSTYDGEAEGFVFLATDEAKIYVKESATSGDWSDGISLVASPVFALAISVGDKPNDGEIIEGHIFVDAITFPSGFVSSRAIARAAPTADAAFDVLHNGSSVGTVTFAAGETDGVFALASDLVVAPGDTLDLQAPSPADATLSGIKITLRGSR